MTFFTFSSCVIQNLKLFCTPARNSQAVHRSSHQFGRAIRCLQCATWRHEKLRLLDGNIVGGKVKMRPSISGHFRASHNSYALKKGAAFATNNATPIKATGGVTPVATPLPKKSPHVFFVAGSRLSPNSTLSTEASSSRLLTMVRRYLRANR